MNEMTKPSAVRNEPVALSSYEEFGQAYAEALADNAYNAHFERPSTLALLPELANKRVLDAGCGPGAYVGTLLEGVGVDVSPAMLDIATSRFGNRARFILHDLSNPLAMLAGSSFDLVLTALAIHYVADLSALLCEFSRVLKQNGHVVMSTHHPMSDFQDSPTQRYFEQELIEQDWNTIGRPVRVRFYRRPLSQLTSSIARAGFEIEALTEGLLTDVLRDKYPRVYEKLSRKPQFLFLRARKCR